jgi:hypothetical protein
MPDLAIQYVSPGRLRPYPGNARTHSRKQLKLIENSIKRFGFTNPILVTDDFEVVAGHGRLQAAKSLAMQLVPVVALSSLSEADKKALIIADNRIAELSNWDRDILAIEYQSLHDLQFDDLEVTGFSLGEIDTILDEASEKQPIGPGPEDDLPPVVAAPVSRQGDLWIMGSHRLVCGDARSDKAYARLLDGKSADLVLTDPPFNVRIDGNVTGLGKVRHEEFAMASGEMSEAEFTAFLYIPRLREGPFQEWCHPVRVHGLAAPVRTDMRRPRAGLGPEELDRMGQGQCRHGDVLPFQA